MATQARLMRSLGLNIGDMLAVLTDKYGQPVCFIHRTSKDLYNLVTERPRGAYAIPTTPRHEVPEHDFLFRIATEFGIGIEEAGAGALRIANRCEGHRRRRLWRMHGLKFTQPQTSWFSGEGVVVVDVVKFDAAWSHDTDYYVGPGGVGKSSQPGRYRRFQEWLSKTGGKTPIEMSEVSIGIVDGSGVPEFTNGRHRLAVLRDMGYETLPVSVDVYSQETMQRLYGAR